MARTIRNRPSWSYNIHYSQELNENEFRRDGTPNDNFPRREHCYNGMRKAGVRKFVRRLLNKRQRNNVKSLCLNLNSFCEEENDD